MVDWFLTIVTLIIVVVTIANICDIIRNYTDKKIEIDRLRVVCEQKLDKKDIEILDEIINEIFTDYRTMHFDYIRPDEAYITAEDQKKMILDILQSVLDTISENLYTKLSLYYKKDHIDDIIYKKIQMIVLSYTIEINGQVSPKK